MPLVRKPQQPPGAAAPALAEVLIRLGSASPDERWDAARAAAALPEATAALAAALPEEPDARVREAMFTSLVRIGTPESVAGLLPMLRSNDSALRTGALDALRSSAVVPRELLRQLLGDPDPDVRILSCELVRRLPSEEACAILCALLAAEPEINVCAAAIEVLAEVGDASALPVLGQCAERFAHEPFLRFASQLAADRIRAAGSRG
ncbi:MAG TPA: HEAT repeat domain-containing protein [Steroidobacteraceae bacterium]|nr:HEAT repeat domain-containing protein [Steroidobacteraceae bacterium]